MCTRRTALTFILSTLVLCILVSTLYAQETKKEETLRPGEYYLAYNVWYEQPDSLYAINYKAGTFIPAGTKVTGVVLGRYRNHPTLSFRPAKGGGPQYVIHFTERFHPGVTINDFKQQLLTTKSFDELTSGMTELEIECIKKGVIKPGMSKEAVLVAYGYPPEHKTPTLERNTWYYWMNRFRSKEVRFDENGKTVTTIIE